MKIIITGGAGFIGSHFVCAALEQGHHVINIDKLTYAGNLDNLEHYQHHSNYVFYKEDVCNREFMEQVFLTHYPDVVVHMAAESHVDRSIDCSDAFVHTNINGTHAVLNACLKHYKSLVGKSTFRLLHLSTDEVFGALGTTGKFDETMPYRPNSPYAASKAASDLLVRSYFQTYGLPSIIVNSSNNYGPKQYPEKLIPLTILNALEHKPLPVYGNGKQVRDWLFVKDHIEALLCIIKKGHVGKSYCVGSDNEITNLDLVHRICSILHRIKPSISYKSLIKYVQDRPGHDFRYATDASALKKDTGWIAQTSFEDGLEKTIEWYISKFEKFKEYNLNRIRIGLGT